ncbi:isochorismatase family protein [Rhizobium sp. PP-F2F-G36]|nr:isochorismatase family protein [Rhizobium sp. PP-F2F-G36]
MLIPVKLKKIIMNKHVVIFVDPQKDHLTSGRFALEAIDLAVANAPRITAPARKAGVKIINIRHENRVGATFFEPGTEDLEILPEMTSPVGETIITKLECSPFYRTGRLV